MVTNLLYLQEKSLICRDEMIGIIFAPLGCSSI